MKLKNFILPVVLIMGIGGYIIYKQFSSSPASQPQTLNNDQTSAPSESINPNAGGQTNPPPTPPTTQTGYKDGQYTGDVASSIYGDAQVKVTISGGRITDIQMLKTPTKPGYTAELVASSFPILKSEAIASQKAQVDVVSGATQNSETFSQSLASALSKAS